MATVTDSDLKELKDLINSRFDSIEKRLTVIETTMLTQQPFIQKIPDLAEKVGELKNWKQISLVFITAFVSSVLTGTLGGVIGWLIRGGKP